MDLLQKLQRSRWLNYWLVHLLVITVGILLIATGGVVVVSIGASLAATGIAGLVLYLYVKFHYHDIQKLEHLRTFGFDDAFEGRSVMIKQEYDRRLRTAQSAVDIMGFGLKHLKEDYASEFSTWAAKAKVRILLIDPDSPSKEYSYAAQRSLEEQDENDSIENSVRAFLDATQAVRADPEGAFQVRLFTCLPSVNIFRVDNDMFWGPYLIREQSRNTPTFLVRRGGVLFERLLEHFERIWNEVDLSKEPPSPPQP